MRVVVFGASGMIGQAVMREALLDSEVEAVLSVVRRPGPSQHAKLRELVHADFSDFTSIASELTGYDACLFCLGVSSAGMSEAEYRKITYDVTVAAGQVLSAANPAMTLLFVSGVGSDSTEKGRSMWARVKGAAENALISMPFKAVYLIRPAYIQPRHGVVSRTRWTRISYAAFSWLYPVWKTLFPRHTIESDQLARAMLHVAKHGAPQRILTTPELRPLGTTLAA